MHAMMTLCIILNSFIRWHYADINRYIVNDTAATSPTAAKYKCISDINWIYKFSRLLVSSAAQDLGKGNGTPPNLNF